MKKQYLAEVKFREAFNGEWRNASLMFGGPRYCRTKTDAKNAIARAKKHYNRGARTEHQVAGCIGIATVVDEKTAYRMNIVDSRIRVREVTEWKEC